MMRKLLFAPTFILAISNATEVPAGRQAVFFIAIIISSATVLASRFFLQSHYTTDA
jgi:hypothetical protein